MRHFLSLAALLAATGALPAQTLATQTDQARATRTDQATRTDLATRVARPIVTTVTRAGVFADHAVRSLPAGVSILRPTALAVEAPFTGASLQIIPSHERGSHGAAFRWSAHAGGPSDIPRPAVVLQAGTTGNGSPGRSPQTYVWPLWSESGHGTLVIEFKGILANRAEASATVAVGDRAVNFVAADPGHSKRIVIDLKTPAGGLPVKITLAGVAAGTLTTSSFEAALFLRFTPATTPVRCKIGPHHRSCPRGGKLTGAILSNSDRPDASGNHIVLSLEGALPNAFGLTIAAGHGRLGPSPFTDCPLLLRPMLVGFFHTDDRGNARTELPFPTATGDLEFFLQQLTVKFGDAGFHVASSNTLAVVCSH